MLEGTRMGAEKLMARSDRFQSPLHRHEVGGGDIESVPDLEQNHRSTDVKSAGTAFESGTCPVLVSG